MGVFWIFHYFIQHFFTCHPSDSTVSTTALAVRRSRLDLIHISFSSLYLFVCIRSTCSARKWRCGSNSECKLWPRFEFADFILVRAASLFTLRTFGAQINWRIISRKVLFDPQRFLSNKSPIHFAGESGKGNMFLNGKRHVQNENGHRSPRSETYAQQL
jgi:hypothetical protein